MRNSLCIFLLSLCCCVMAQTSSDINGDGSENAHDVSALAAILLGERDAYGSHQFVDLGLPSGTLWATTNVGAQSREDFGYYVAWGEYMEKPEYTWANYKWGEGSHTLTRYCRESTNGTVDGMGTLLDADDVAHRMWHYQWQVPSVNQIMELVDNCTWVWSSVNGVKGYYVFGRNNRSIFLPATGYVDGTDLCNVGTDAVYWTRELFHNNDAVAYGLLIEKGYRSWAIRERYLAMPVRPVTTPSSVFCDRNGDGRISISDVTELIRSVAHSN